MQGNAFNHLHFEIRERQLFRDNNLISRLPIPVYNHEQGSWSFISSHVIVIRRTLPQTMLHVVRAHIMPQSVVSWHHTWVQRLEHFLLYIQQPSRDRGTTKGSAIPSRAGYPLALWWPPSQGSSAFAVADRLLHPTAKARYPTLSIQAQLSRSISVITSEQNKEYKTNHKSRLFCHTF